MATLVNREAWTTAFGGLSHGRIIKQGFDPDICILLTDSGYEIPVGSKEVLLNLHAAVLACEQQFEYWQYKLHEMEQAESEQA